MRKRQLDDGFRLYFSPAEYRTLLDLAPEISVRSEAEAVELFLRLGGESGLRVSEIADKTRSDKIESSAPDSDVMFLEVLGKDSTGETENGKYRKTILTKASAACMHEISQERGLADDDPYVSVQPSSLRKWATKLGELAAEKTGKDDFRHFSPHDLRAYFATNCLVRHGMNVETVMTVGGWEDYQTMQRYLSVTSDGQIIEDFQEAGLLEGAGWRDHRDIERDGESVYSKISAATPVGAAAQLSALGADQMATRVETLAEQSQEEDWTLGRCTRTETETALRAGKYGAFLGVGAAGVAGAVPSLGASAMLPIATVALIAPLARRRLFLP
jgi:hypothetical protein